MYIIYNDFLYLTIETFKKFTENLKLRNESFI